MKTIILLLVVILLAFAFKQNAFAKSSNKNMEKLDLKNKKVLVVYYSITGNTKTVAEKIQQFTNADIFRLETVKKYSDEYHALTEEAKKEINEGFKPELKSNIDVKDYDVIFIGSPCWWSTYVPAVSTFLSINDLSNKTIIPFMTHEGSRLGSTERHLKRDAPNSTIVHGLAIYGHNANSSDKTIENFINNL